MAPVTSKKLMSCHSRIRGVTMAQRHGGKKALPFRHYRRAAMQFGDSPSTL
ncbi:hypothetical protein MTR67_012265, partial [Solanum verrucosum]